jgi:hypothetical protein
MLSSASRATPRARVLLPPPWERALSRRQASPGTRPLASPPRARSSSTPWAPSAHSTDSALVTAIQAVVAASQEREHATSLTLEQECAMGVALIAQRHKASTSAILRSSLRLLWSLMSPPRLWTRRRPHRRSPRLGCRDAQHSVPRVRCVGPDIHPVPSLVGSSPHAFASTLSLIMPSMTSSPRRLHHGA